MFPLPDDLQLSADVPIGEGGSAIVFAALWRGEPVALKIARLQAFADDRAKTRFLSEAQILARCAHPGVVRLLGSGQLPDGRPYLLMPLLRGRTLATRVSQGPLPLPQALSLLDQLAEAVHAVHTLGLIHRDLKPSNVFLLEGDKTVVLLDLGIARDLDAGSSTTTNEGLVRGTPSTMAPERFFGSPASVASDIYELGVVAYSMFTGMLPWGDLADAEARVCPKLPSDWGIDLPAGLVTELMRALSTRPERRPASARAFAEQLRKATDINPAPAMHTDALPVALKQWGDNRSRSLGRIGGGFVLATVVIAALVAFTGTAKRNSSASLSLPAVSVPSASSNDGVDVSSMPSYTSPVRPLNSDLGSLVEGPKGLRSSAPTTTNGPPLQQLRTSAVDAASSLVPLPPPAAPDAVVSAAVSSRWRPGLDEFSEPR